MAINRVVLNVIEPDIACELISEAVGLALRGRFAGTLPGLFPCAVARGVVGDVRGGEHTNSEKTELGSQSLQLLQLPSSAVSHLAVRRISTRPSSDLMPCQRMVFSGES